MPRSLLPPPEPTPAEYGFGPRPHPSTSRGKSAFSSAAFWHRNLRSRPHVRSFDGRSLSSTNVVRSNRLSPLLSPIVVLRASHVTHYPPPGARHCSPATLSWAATKGVQPDRPGRKLISQGCQNPPRGFEPANPPKGALCASRHSAPFIECAIANLRSSLRARAYNAGEL
jgi:hypothetical protein